MSSTRSKRYDNLMFVSFLIALACLGICFIAFLPIAVPIGVSALTHRFGGQCDENDYFCPPTNNTVHANNTHLGQIITGETCRTDSNGHKRCEDDIEHICTDPNLPANQTQVLAGVRVVTPQSCLDSAEAAGWVAVTFLGVAAVALSTASVACLLCIVAARKGRDRQEPFRERPIENHGHIREHRLYRANVFDDFNPSCGHVVHSEAPHIEVYNQSSGASNPCEQSGHFPSVEPVELTVPGPRCL